MIAAPQPVFFDDAVDQIGSAVGTLAIDETVAAILGPECDEVLAEQANRLDPQIVDLGYRGKGVPISPQQLTHGRARPDPSKAFIRCSADHYAPSPASLN